MTKLTLSPNFSASVRTGDAICYGELMHVAQNVRTPVGSYYVRHWCPGPFDGLGENIRRHTRIDCYVREHKLAPDPEAVARKLLAALLERGDVLEPVYLSCHRSHELRGVAQGEVYDPD